MITPELRQFVAQAMAAGQSADDIRQTLRSQGWESLDVEQALAQSSQAPVAPAPRGSFPRVFQMIGGAFKLFRSRARVLLTVAAVAGVMLTVGQWLGYGSLEAKNSFRSNDEMTFPGGIPAMVGYGFAMLVYTVAWFAGLVAIVRRDAVSLRQAVAEVPRKLLPLIWVTILASAVTMGGFLLLIIPGLLFAVWFSFASYVYLAQGIGGLRALSLSREYARGAYWRIVWAFFAFGIIFGIAFVIIAVALMGLSVVTGPVGFIFSLLFGIVLATMGLLYTSYTYQVFLGLQARRGEIAETPRATAPIVAGFIGCAILVALAIGGALSPKSNDAKVDLSSLGGQTEIAKMFEFAAVRAGVEAYREDNGSYPSKLSDIGSDYLNVTSVDVSKFTYTSTGATYQLCTTIGGQQKCEGPSGSTPTAPGQ